MIEEGDRFIDAESYKGGVVKDRLTFKQIVLNHLSRIIVKMTVEWKGGYWETRTKTIRDVGITDKYYVPDTRAEFENGVYGLYDLLISYFDKQMVKEDQAVNQELEDLKKEALKQKWNDEKYINKRVLVIRKLFQALNKLLYRLHYLEGKTFEGDE
jgi:hypothetical protein